MNSPHGIFNYASIPLALQILYLQLRIGSQTDGHNNGGYRRISQGETIGADM